IANQPPPVWEIELPDLRSRMAATPKIAVYEPGDALIAARLRRHFAAHGTVIADPAIDYALKRIERSHLAVHQLIEAAETLSIERQSAVTRNLIRDAMEELGFV
ncbi:MAG: chromosomal replication initiator DnaA, partial [Parasphingopyxis sp.]